jgi:hypothetical protein
VSIGHISCRGCTYSGHDRVKKAEATWPEEDLGFFWHARKSYLPAHLRLEDNPADVGVNPEKQNHYRLTGPIINMDKFDPVFKNDYNGYSFCHKTSPNAFIGTNSSALFRIEQFAFRCSSTRTSRIVLS